MDLRCEFCKNKCCIYLPEAPQTERKGPRDRRASARRAGLRIPGPVQKTGMVHVHLVVHKHVSSMVEHSPSSERCWFDSGICKAKECTASGKKINLLFCNMNTYKGRKLI